MLIAAGISLGGCGRSHLPAGASDSEMRVLWPMTGDARVRPSKFIPHQERRLGRPLSEHERLAVQTARETCKTGKGDTVKAMWVAIRELERRAFNPTHIRRP